MRIEGSPARRTSLYSKELRIAQSVACFLSLHLLSFNKTDKIKYAHYIILNRFRFLIENIYGGGWMFKLNGLILKLSFLSQFLCLLGHDVVNIVDHKNLQLNLYLDLIKYNTHEKLGILPFILDKTTGNYLEVGTGGDPIAELLSKIPNNMSPTIIASDIDESILASLPCRHPQLKNFIDNKKSGPCLKLQQLDATNMRCFSDEYLDGINASAVVHEIVSYAGGLKALESFFKEAFRVLKKDGVLIYRDPESVTDKEELVYVNFKTPSIRLFTHIFIVKFLDTQNGRLSKAGRKNNLYNLNDIKFHIYRKNESQLSILSYDQYIKTRSYEIDFSRQYSLNIPRGLCREIERHYLTYLHQCNPLVYVKCIPHIDSDCYFVNFLAHSTQNVLDNFLGEQGLTCRGGSIEINTKRLLDEKICKITQPIEYGIPFHFASKYKERLIVSILQKYGFDPNFYIIPINNGDFLIDYRILSLLYDDIIDVLDCNNGPINKEDLVHAQYLKREGEETYIYYSDDELITNVAEATFDITTGYLLCPISLEHNKFIPRLCYDEVLNDSMEIKNSLGYSVEIKEGKRIINFKKMYLIDAFIVLEDIINSNPEHYQKLRNFLNYKMIFYSIKCMILEKIYEKFNSYFINII